MRTLDVVQFDTAEGIREHLGSLDDLHAVLGARGEAGYQRGERLSEWCLMGRFALDTCGNTGKYIADGLAVIPAEVDPLITDVMPADQLGEHLKRKLGDRDFSMGWSLGSPDIPTSSTRCGECHDGWTVRSAHDSQGIFEREPMSLAEFAGQTIHAANEELRDSRSRDGVRWFTPKEWSVKSPGVTDDRGRDWRRAGEDYVIQEGDEGEVNLRRFAHPNCQQEKTNRVTREQFEAALEEAGFEDFDMQPVPNQYSGGETGTSWYRVTTKNGKPVLIGWRKRVIDIQWLGDDFEGNIAGEDAVTKSGTNAHAWGYKKATEYLDRLRHGLGA